MPKVFNGGHSADHVLVLIPGRLLILWRVPQRPLLQKVYVSSIGIIILEYLVWYLLQLVDWSGDVWRKAKMGSEGHVDTLVRNQGCVLDFVIRGRLNELDLLLGFCSPGWGGSLGRLWWRRIQQSILKGRPCHPSTRNFFHHFDSHYFLNKRINSGIQ